MLLKLKKELPTLDNSSDKKTWFVSDVWPSEKPYTPLN